MGIPDVGRIENLAKFHIPRKKYFFKTVKTTEAVFTKINIKKRLAKKTSNMKFDAIHFISKNHMISNVLNGFKPKQTLAIELNKNMRIA